MNGHIRDRGRDRDDRPSVLLVDDVEANLVALTGLLEDMDCRIVRVRSGNDALRQLLKREFAVILLDIQMPEMDGYEVAHYARDNPATREIPIIFLTASRETDERVLRAFGPAPLDVLSKPMSPVILRSKVRVLLDLYTTKRRLADAVEAHDRALAELAEARALLDNLPERSPEAE